MSYNPFCYTLQKKTPCSNTFAVKCSFSHLLCVSPQLADVEETLQERLVGLTEMVPVRVWKTAVRTLSFSSWLLKRSAWVLGSSLALLALPPFIEQQRMELEDMHNMQKKQVCAVFLAWFPGP